MHSVSFFSRRCIIEPGKEKAMKLTPVRIAIIVVAVILLAIVVWRYIIPLFS
jgi:hypothetical protein